MYLELRTWKGSWFGGESAIHTRPFGHNAAPPREVFGFAAGWWEDSYTTAAYSPLRLSSSKSFTREISPWPPWAAPS